VIKLPANFSPDMLRVKAQVKNKNVKSWTEDIPWTDSLKTE
jgi:hypothetical protein